MIVLAPLLLFLSQQSEAPSDAPSRGPEPPPEGQVPEDQTPEEQAPVAPGESGQSGESSLSVTGETVVTATREERPARELPYSTSVVEDEDILRRNYRTTPQALRDIPGVMVQETAHGQGSPYIRGFTGFRNVFLIDGIRLNNSVFRDGPNQYWNTVDPFSLDRIEVVKGPSSVLYGSDAIGGTVQAITKRPHTYGDGFQFGGEFYYRAASAEESHIGRLELGASMDDRTGILIGLTGKEFGDLRGGSDTGNQPNTGYDEYDGDIKLEHFIDPNTRLSFGYQKVRLNNVPRTHRTVFAVPFEGTTIGSDLRRDLDQERELVYAQIHGTEVDSFFDTYSASISWHEQSEVRDRIRDSGSREMQGFDVGTLGVVTQMGSSTSIGRLTYGFDYYHDNVDSFSTRNDIQGPVADDAEYDLVGVFIQDEIDFGEDWTLTIGERFNYAAADADSVLDPETGNQTSISDDWSSFAGSARMLYRAIEEKLHVFGGISQGFRAPNLSDLTRFDSARTDEFEIPSPGLDPEEFLTYELGVHSTTEQTASELSVFYTDISDQIVRSPTGNTNSDGESEITKSNVGDGYIWGIEAGAAYDFAQNWTLFGNATYLEGMLDTFPTSSPVAEREYVDRLMPFTAQLGLLWEHDSVWVEARGIYADDADRLSTRDESDTSRIPPGGTPNYAVLHLRGGWQVNEAVAIFTGIENVTDEDYRVHGSGLTMAGRNFVIGLRTSF